MQSTAKVDKAEMKASPSIEEHPPRPLFGERHKSEDKVRLSHNPLQRCNTFKRSRRVRIGAVAGIVGIVALCLLLPTCK